MQRALQHLFRVIRRFHVSVGVLHEVEQPGNEFLVDFRHLIARSVTVLQIFLYYIDRGTIIVIGRLGVRRVASNSLYIIVKPVGKIRLVNWIGSPPSVFISSPSMPSSRFDFISFSFAIDASLNRFASDASSGTRNKLGYSLHLFPFS